jgi:flagellar export protein FliJ
MNNTWKILANRAKTATEEAQSVVVTARARVTQLQASLDHIETLRVDYITRYHATQKEMHMIADNLAYRQFLEHLGSLTERVTAQMETAQAELESVKALWSEAYKQQLKMEAMVERDATNKKNAAIKLEQKQTDQAGITQFNLR